MRKFIRRLFWSKKAGSPLLLLACWLIYAGSNRLHDSLDTTRQRVCRQKLHNTDSETKFNVCPGSPPETFTSNIICFHLVQVLPPSDSQNLSEVDMMTSFFCLMFHFISSVCYIIVIFALHTGRNSAQQTVSTYRRPTGSGRIIAGRRTETDLSHSSDQFDPHLLGLGHF